MSANQMTPAATAPRAPAASAALATSGTPEQATSAKSRMIHTPHI